MKTSASCSAQALSTRPGMPSGPAALCTFTKVAHMSMVESVSGRPSGVSTALMAGSVFQYQSEHKCCSVIREGGIAVWGCAVFWFIVCEGMDACPHAPRFVVFKSVINAQ